MNSPAYPPILSRWAGRVFIIRVHYYIHDGLYAVLPIHGSITGLLTRIRFSLDPGSPGLQVPCHGTP